MEHIGQFGYFVKQEFNAIIFSIVETVEGLYLQTQSANNH